MRTELCYCMSPRLTSSQMPGIINCELWGCMNLKNADELTYYTRDTSSLKLSRERVGGGGGEKFEPRSTVGVFKKDMAPQQ